MKKLIFVGWQNDYDREMFDELKIKFNISIINFSKLDIYLFNILNRFSNKKYAIDYLVLRYSKYFLSCNDDQVYIGIDSNISASFISQLIYLRTIIIFRNTYTSSLKFSLELPSTDIYTFDKNDSAKYGMILTNQFVPNHNILTSENKKSTKNLNKTAYFLGLNKNRKLKLLNLKDVLSEVLITDFHIKEKLSGFKKLFYIFYKWNRNFRLIPYHKSIKDLKKSDLVVEMVKKDQAGLTFRALEAMFSGKKLITNNKNIVNEPFYNSSNIYIYDDISPIAPPEEFILEGFLPVDYEILKKYTATDVFNNILMVSGHIGNTK